MPVDVFDQVAGDTKTADVFDVAAEDEVRAKKATERRGEAEKLLARYQPQTTIFDDPEAGLATMFGHQLTRAALLSGGKKTDVAIGVAAPLAGTVAGGLAAGPVGAAGAGAASSGAADALVQAREYLRGERDDLSEGRFLASTGIGAVVPPAVKAAATPLMTAAKTLLVRGAQGAGLGAAHEAVSEAIDEHKLKPGQILTAGALGSLFGAAFGVLEGAAPHILKALRGKTPEEARKVIAEEVSKIDTDAAMDAATKAEVRGVLEGAAKRIDDMLGVKPESVTPTAGDTAIGRQAAGEQAFGGEAPLTRIQKADERAAGLRAGRAEQVRDRLLSRQIGEGENVILTGDEVQNQLTRLETAPGEARRERARLLAKLPEKPTVSDEAVSPNVELPAQASRLLAAEGYDVPPPVVRPRSPTVSQTPKAKAAEGLSEVYEQPFEDVGTLLAQKTEKPPVKAASEGVPPSSDTGGETPKDQAGEVVPEPIASSNRKIADQRRKIKDMERQAKKLDERAPDKAAELRTRIATEQETLAQLVANKKDGARPTVGVDPNGDPDILTDIAEHVGTLRTAGDSESKARLRVLEGVARRLRGGAEGAEWTDAIEILNGIAARDFSEGGKYNFRSPAELEDAISNALNNRQRARSSLKVEEYQHGVESKFIAANEEDGARLLASGKGRLVEEIGVGGKFKIDGEKFSIVGVEETADGTFEYIVKDGHLFRVPEGTVVMPDKGRVTGAKPLSKQKDVGFLPEGEEPPPAVREAKVDPVAERIAYLDEQLAAKEITADEHAALVATAKGEKPILESATVEQQAAEAATAREKLLAQKQRDEIAARAEKPLVGDSSDVGQGTLLAQDEDMFSGPSAERLLAKSSPKKPAPIEIENGREVHAVNNEGRPIKRNPETGNWELMSDDEAALLPRDYIGKSVLRSPEFDQPKSREPLREAIPPKKIVTRERERESGRINPRLLFSTPIQSALGGVGGAAYGSTQGDTLEERRQNMLLYGAAGAGIGAGSRIAGKAILSRVAGKPIYEIDKHLAPPPGKTVAEKVAGAPNSVKAATLTVFAPLDKLAADVAKENAGVVSVLPRAIPLSREFEQVAGATGKGAQDVRDYVRNVLDVVGDVDRQNFDRIVALKRIEQRLAWNDAHASDRKVVGDWTHAKVASDLAALESNIGAKRVGELDAIAGGIMQKEADDALRLQVTSGRLSEEAYNAIKADNDFYAPFKVLDHLEGHDTGGGRAIDTRDSLAKVIDGIHSTDFHIENPSVALAQHIFKGRVLAEKNLKMLELAALADQDASGKFIRRLEAHDEPRRGYETVNYFEDGKPLRLEVKSDVAAAVKGLNATEAGLLANFARKAGGLFRFGATTGNLGFQPVNFALADQPNLWLVSKYGLNTKDVQNVFRTPIDFAHGMYASIFSNLLGGEGGAFANATAKVPLLNKANDAAAKLARQFHESGATGSNWQELVDTMGGTVDEKRLLGSLKLGEHSLLDSVGSVNKAIEESTKMMGFKRGLRIEGIDKMTPAAAEEALKKIVTEVRNFAGSPDFMRSGYATRDLNNLVQMFLNARVQGVTNLTGRLAGADGAEAARDAWIRIGGTIGVGAAYLWYQNHRPENEADYASRSETERKNYFLFPRYDDNGQPLYSQNEFGQKVREYWRLPKREVLQYMGNTVESALDFAYEKDPDAVKKYGLQMVENLSPVNISGKTGRERMESVVGGANPLVKVPYEQLSGRDTFRHRDILPTDDLKRASPTNQFVETTPKILVRAAKAMPDFAPDNLRSPMLLQNLVEGTTGRALTQFLPKQQPEGRDPTAAAVASNPLTSRFAGSLYVDRSADQSEIDKLKQAEADTRVEKRRTARETLNELKTLTADEVSKRLNEIASNRPELFEQIMTEINKSERDVIDRQLLNLGVKNGARAQFIAGKLRRMTGDQAKEYMLQISQGDAPPLTPEVFEQVTALLGSQ